MKHKWFEDDCPICKALEEGGEDVHFVDIDEIAELEKESSRIPRLLKLGKHERAEVAARELIRKYPGYLDGLDRLAQVQEARGRFADSVQTLESAIAFTHEDEFSFDDEIRESFRNRIERLKAKLT